MAVNSGTDVLISVGGTTVNGMVSSSSNETVDTIDITTNDSSGGAKEFLAGEDTWTLTAEGKLNPSVTYGITELRTAKDAKAAVAVIFGKGVSTSGEWTLSGNAIITSLDVSAPKNDAVTWTCNLQGTGGLTEGTSA